MAQHCSERGKEACHLQDQGKQLTTELHVEGKIIIDGDELDEKIKTARKTILAVEYLIPIENENYTAVRNKVINNGETFPMEAD